MSIEKSCDGSIILTCCGDLIFMTSGIERFRIKNCDILNRSESFTALALYNTLLVIKDNLVKLNNSQELTNKIIDLDQNDIIVDGVNLKDLLDSVQSFTDPIFNTVTSEKLIINAEDSSPININDLTGQILFRNNGQDVFSFGLDQNQNLIFKNIAGGDFNFSIGNSNVLSLNSNGIITDNNATNILGLDQTTLKYKSNLVGASDIGVFSNKTIESTDNTIELFDPNGTKYALGNNINNIIDQNVQTGSSPVFVSFRQTDRIFITLFDQTSLNMTIANQPYDIPQSPNVIVNSVSNILYANNNFSINPNSTPRPLLITFSINVLNGSGGPDLLILTTQMTKANMDINKTKVEQQVGFEEYVVISSSFITTIDHNETLIPQILTDVPANLDFTYTINIFEMF